MAAAIVSRYIKGLTLRKIGYVFDINELDVFTAECFSIIASEINKHEIEEIRGKKGR